jgi:hypothetical protein
MNYTINPCKACSKKFQNSDCNINDLNDCFLDTLAAYRNNHNNFIVLDGVESNWKECMSNKMAKLPYVAGKPRTFCNFQLNRAPVFIEGEHYFPNQLNNNNGDAEKALNMCKLECKNSRLPNTCVENCQVDYDALVPHQPIPRPMSQPMSQPMPQPMQRPMPQLRKVNNPSVVKEMYNGPAPANKDNNNINDIVKEHPVTFYTTFAIVAILFAIIIFVFIYTISTKN